jgi:hypothetical protein
MNLTTSGGQILQSLRMRGSSLKFIKAELNQVLGTESIQETEFTVSQLSGQGQYLWRRNRQKATLVILFDGIGLPTRIQHFQ